MSKFRTKVKKYLSSENDNGGIANQLFHEEISDEDIPAEFGAKFVDQHGGEGDGDEFWWIFSFTDSKTSETLLVKINGSYASYNGRDYDEWFFVVGKEVMVTKYEKEEL